MNFKQIVKQTEQRQKAVKAVEKVATREKKNILMAFAKPILQYLLYIHNNKDYQFCSEAHVYPSTERRPLFGCLGQPKTWKDTISTTSSTETFIRVNIITGLSFFCSSVSITFRIDDDYIPIVRYCVKGSSVRENEFEFKDQEEFIKSFTELLIKLRR